MPLKPQPLPVITPADVICPVCRAEAFESCRSKDDMPRRNHSERVTFAAEITAKAARKDDAGKWLRHRLRSGWRPTPPQPCGTWGAYNRHLRHNEPIDDACRAAARAYYRDADERRRAKRLSTAG